MKKKKLSIAGIGLMICITLAIACKKNDAGNGDLPPFDQKAMLANYSDNLIVPAYTTLADEADQLAAAATAFSAAAGETTLEALQVQFKSAYKAWLHCEPYDFGPANDVVMLSTAISFPAKPDLINAELSATAELSDSYISSLGAQKKGFAALAYLLFDLNAGNSAVLNTFISGPDKERRKNYIVALAKNIEGNVHTVLDAWNNSYATTFKNNTGTQLNTSLSLLLNNIVVALETSKNVRIGIPIGRKDNFTQEAVDPGAVELPTTGLAKEMLQESAAALSDIFQGNSSKGNGPGFDDYVATLKVASDSSTLEKVINAELVTYGSDISAIPSPMQTTIATDPSTVYTTWVQSKKLIVLTKVDLASNLGILITFSDNDGD